METVIRERMEAGNDTNGAETEICVRKTKR